MGRLGEALRAYWNPPLPTRDPGLSRYFGYGPRASGISVTEASALNYSAWWAAVQLISNAVASLPLFLYKRLPNGGKERFVDSKTYRLLHDEFNPEMTSVKARQTMQAHVLTRGNAYAEIVRDGAERPALQWLVRYVENELAVVTPGQSFDAHENLAAGSTIGTVVATDADPDTTLSQWQLTDPSGNFAIDSSTGVISVVSGATLDFEAVVSYTVAVPCMTASGAAPSRTS